MESAMNMIYNSQNYCVVEFPSFAAHDGNQQPGGFEIMDKTSKREIFLGGVLGEAFRKDVRSLIDSEPSTEEIDEYLSRFDSMMQQPLVLH
jgi:hypothetical protein